MKAVKRRTELLALIKERGLVTTKEIAELFDVTKMTIHRDLEYLESHGFIRRIFGGAVPANGEQVKSVRAGLPGGERTFLMPFSPEVCLICRRPVTQHLLYALTLATGEQVVTCCPHCGLTAHLRHRDAVTSAMTADFIDGRPHPARRSHFLLGSSATPCCIPSILTFESEEQAHLFQEGFKGRIGTIAEALEYLEAEMTPGEGKECPHCSS